MAEHGTYLSGGLKSRGLSDYARCIELVSIVLELVGDFGNETFGLAEHVVFGLRTRPVRERSSTLMFGSGSGTKAFSGTGFWCHCTTFTRSWIVSTPHKTRYFSANPRSGEHSGKRATRHFRVKKCDGNLGTVVCIDS